MIMHLVRMNCLCDDLKRQRGNLHYEWYEMSLTIFDILPQADVVARAELDSMETDEASLGHRDELGWLTRSLKTRPAYTVIFLSHRNDYYNDYCHLRRE